jgi:hypothetical protein
MGMMLVPGARRSRLKSPRYANNRPSIFGTIKRWFGYDHFRLIGLAKVRCGLSLITLAYNLKRALSLVSFPKLRVALARKPCTDL